MTFLDRPMAGLDDDEARRLMDACRGRATQGECVVLTCDDARTVAARADTVALVVAGRLVSWGVPGVALVPALQILGAGAAAS